MTARLETRLLLSSRRIRLCSMGARGEPSQTTFNTANPLNQKICIPVLFSVDASPVAVTVATREPTSTSRLGSDPPPVLCDVPLKLRQDLITGPPNGTNGGGIVLKDPAAGRFFRFGATEGFILKQLDGATPLDIVRQRTEQRFGAALSAETMQCFAGQLRQLGLLEDPTQPASRHKRGRIRGNIFYLRLKALDPDQLLDALAARLRFFFT